MYTAVLCALLAFSGFLSESRIGQPGRVQTEVRVSFQNNSRSATSYNDLSLYSNVEAPYPDYEVIDRNAFLLHYERIIETRFLNNLQHKLSYNKPGKLVRTPYTRRSYYAPAHNS